MYTWTIHHSNVNTAKERGTEHGLFSETQNGSAGKFNGRITDYDFGSTGDPCGSHVIYYASGRIGVFDHAGSCASNAPGNFNGHGTSHYRGQYGTVVYQRTDNSLNNPCKDGSNNYCFEAILKGQTN